jgi:glycosyltransferase involved in cell wall biosynthesis
LHYSKGDELMESFPYLVSVVIPTYNRAKTIVKSINSILSQSYSNIEIIVVDDCSSDNTHQVILDNFSKIHNLTYVKHEINKGGNAARNTGIDVARGKLIAFLDSDDEWINTKIEKQVDRIIKNENCGLVYTACENVDLISSHIVSYSYEEPSNNPFYKLLCQNFIGTTSSILCRKRCLLAVGKFDESLPSCQDWELYIRMAQRYSIEYINEALLKYYVHSDSITGNCRNAIKGHEIITEKVLKILDTNKLDSLERRVLYFHYKKRADIFLKFGMIKKSIKYRAKSFIYNPLDLKNNLQLLISFGGKNFYSSVTGVKKGVEKSR